jgi:hypothetical protein
MCDDGQYFSRRAQEERLAASKARHPSAKEMHSNLADAYERRARALAATGRRGDMRIVG